MRADAWSGALALLGGMVVVSFRCVRSAVLAPSSRWCWRVGLVAQVVWWPWFWDSVSQWNPGLLRADLPPGGTPRSLLALAVAVGAAAATWRMSPSPERRRGLFPAWLAVVLGAGALLLESVEAMDNARMEREALVRVHSLSLALDPLAVEDLHVGPGGWRTDGFLKVRQQLLRLRRANPDVAYLYVATFYDGHVVYPVSAAERYESEIDGRIVRTSEQMEPYEEGAPISEGWRQAMAEGLPVAAELSRDPHYGVLMSVFAPIRSEPAGPVRFMLGMDFQVQTFLASARRLRWLAEALVLAGVGAAWLFLRYQLGTEVAEAERAARAAAEARDRARNDFLGMVSHELLAPVQVVLAQARTLSDSRAAAVLEAGGRDLQRLMEDLLQASALQGGGWRLQSRRCELRALFGEVAAMAGTAASAKGLAWSCEVAPDVPVAGRLDALRLRQVVVNLLSNAVKYTREGRVGLRVRWLAESPSVDDAARVPAAAGATTHPSIAGRLEIEVSDTGPGIPDEARAHIFEPFVRGGSAIEPGSGLGLAVARELCRRMGGDLSLRPSEPHGCIFVARVAAEVVDPVASNERALPASGQGCAALVLDDHPRMREHLASLLGELGCHVQLAGSCEEADLACAAIPPRVLLVDAQLGEADGADWLRRWRVREEAGHLPKSWIIGISASRDPIVAERMLAAGADDFLFKPVSAEALAEALGLRLSESAPSRSVLASSDASAPGSLPVEELEHVGRALREHRWEEAGRAVHWLHNSALAGGHSEAVLVVLRDLAEAVRAMDGVAALECLRRLRK